MDSRRRAIAEASPFTCNAREKTACEEKPTAAQSPLQFAV